MDGADGWVRIGEVAADLGLSASRIRQLADSGAGAGKTHHALRVYRNAEQRYRSLGQ
jgi:hypothetical protein